MSSDKAKKAKRFELYSEGNLVDTFPSEKEAWEHVDFIERMHGRSGTEEPLMNYNVKET